MASKSKKPYPGMGAFVVVTKESDGAWVAYAGANTMEKARARRRELSHWPGDRLAIVPNNPGDPRR